MHAVALTILAFILGGAYYVYSILEPFIGKVIKCTSLSSLRRDIDFLQESYFFQPPFMENLFFSLVFFYFFGAP